VGEAMLIALGRKVGKNGYETPTEEEVLAYVDGILANWMRKGKPQMRRKVRSSPNSHQRTEAEGAAQPTEISDDPLPACTPKSEEDRLWERVLRDLEIQMTRATFDHWLRGSTLLEFEKPGNGTARLVVGVKHHYAVDWLEHRLKPVIQRVVKRLVGQETELTFQVSNGSGPSVRA
jgi:hypothetical protein